MQLFLYSLILWTLLDGSTAEFFEAAAAKAKRVASDAADAGCHTFAKAIKGYSLREPSYATVGFQLRTPCKRIDIPAKQAAGLRDIPEFDASKKTVIFVSGWITSINKDYIEEVARAYHCRGGHNFLVANTGGAIMNFYINSAYHTNKLGALLARALRDTRLPVQDIHLVGHSLGAHIVGSMGRHYQNLTGVQLVRITGLDPARPCFKTPLAFPRLGPGDAAFIDAIHTNPFDLGMEEVVGDVDTFVEGLDVFKPGCSQVSLRCSHEIAIQYYLETVYPQLENSFMASQCNSYEEMKQKNCNGAKSPMGYATPATLKGVYYVSARKRSPYGPDATGDDSFRNAACGRCPN